MAKYKNRLGERIDVSDEHIEVAIRIKMELQNLSPSGKCNWRKHKKMMKKEGFDDSDYNESYRCLIKAKQKELNLLPSQAKYADFVTDKKIETIDNLVGEMYIVNRERQNINRILNKTKREIADERLVIQEIKELIKETEFVNLKVKEIKETSSGGYVGIVTPSDWHIGLLHNGIGYECAVKKVAYYAEEVINKSKLLGINEVYVVHLGDIINHVYMHKNTQAYSSEFNVSEQIVKSTKLFFEFLEVLSSELRVNYLGTIVGNHGRMSNKGETLTDDNVEVVIHEMIKSLIEMSKNPNIKIDDSNYEKSFLAQKINGRNVAFVHGDKESKTGADRLRKYSSITGKEIDLLIQGHTHTFKVESENYDRKIITSGSLMGSDDYAESLGYYTNASQLMVAVNKNDMIPISISL